MSRHTFPFYFFFFKCGKPFAHVHHHPDLSLHPPASSAIQLELTTREICIEIVIKFHGENIFLFQKFAGCWQIQLGRIEVKFVQLSSFLVDAGRMDGVPAIDPRIGFLGLFACDRPIQNKVSKVSLAGNFVTRFEEASLLKNAHPNVRFEWPYQWQTLLFEYK